MAQSNVIKLAIKMLIAILIWILVHSVIFGIAGKDGGVYILDTNFQIGGWPGRLWERYENTPSFTPVAQIRNTIEMFSMSKDYILIKAGDNWFLVNRSNRTILEFDNIGDAKKGMGIDSEKEIHFTTSRPWLRMGYFWPAAIASAISGMILIFIFAKM